MTQYPDPDAIRAAAVKKYPEEGYPLYPFISGLRSGFIAGAEWAQKNARFVPSWEDVRISIEYARDTGEAVDRVMRLFGVPEPRAAKYHQCTYIFENGERCMQELPVPVAPHAFEPLWEGKPPMDYPVDICAICRKPEAEHERPVRVIRTSDKLKEAQTDFVRGASENITIRKILAILIEHFEHEEPAKFAEREREAG